MLTFLSSIWWFIVAMGILVTIHEFGHYWVAKRVGVKVLKFSIGFGKSLWSITSKAGTEYCIGWIPLGGYVKLLDEREQTVPSYLLPFAFNQQSTIKKMAIVIAGPLVNLIVAVLFFWMFFLIGTQGIKPVIGNVEGIAAASELEINDKITAVGGNTVNTWQTTIVELVSFAMEREDVEIVTVNDKGKTTKKLLALSELPSEYNEKELLPAIGLFPKLPSIEIANIETNSPASAAGLKSGDKIMAIDDNDLNSNFNWIDYISNHPMQELAFKINRDGQVLIINVIPEAKVVDGQSRGIIGIQSKLNLEDLVITIKHGPIQSGVESFKATWKLTKLTFQFLGNIIIGKASLDHLSSPIGIANYARQHAEMGINQFLWFLAILSLSLAILNILPIPVLDGGHLLYHIVEAIKGSPVSEKTQMVGQMLGIMLLMSIMFIAVINDLTENVLP